MSLVVLDTNAYTAFKLGRPAAVEIVASAEQLGLPVVVLAELLAGFAAGNREAANRRELSAFLDSPRVRVLSATEVTADLYARVYAVLRRKGKPIPTNDLWVAAATLEHGAGLFSLDAHFREIDGLRCGQTVEALLI